MSELRERIRALRKEHSWSQAELGERIGVGRIAISGMEQGDRTISVEEAQALAQVFGISLMALLGESQLGADEETPKAELRFEVTVKLLPSREGKPTPEEIRRLIENPPAGEPYAEKVERFAKDYEKRTGRKRVSGKTGKDAKVPSKSAASTVGKRRTKQ